MIINYNNPKRYKYIRVTPINTICINWNRFIQFFINQKIIENFCIYVTCINVYYLNCFIESNLIALKKAGGFIGVEKD